MRLLLDAHISGRRVAEALRERGHDVVAVDEHREWDGMADDEVLQVASDDDRILVTFDVKDFPRIVRSWAESGRRHAGCAIVVGIDHAEFGTILRALDSAFATQPDPEGWVDAAYFVSRNG